MIEAIETIIYKGHAITICYDEFAENPREDFDCNLGVMVASHKRYISPNECKFDFDSANSWKETRNILIRKHKAYIILPVYMYDHGGRVLSTEPFSCPWDSGQYGFIFTTAEKIRETFNVKRISPALRVKVTTELKEEIKAFGAYMNGEIYTWEVPSIDEHAGGYYEPEEAIKDAKNTIDNYIDTTKEDNQLELEFETKVS